MTDDFYIVDGPSLIEDEDDFVITKDGVRYEIRRLIAAGIYHQNDLFDLLYPVYEGHYSTLRDIIAEEKNYA